MRFAFPDTQTAVRVGAVFFLGLHFMGAFSFELIAQQPPFPRPEPVFQDDFSVLNRGPVHEAFAQPYQMKSGEGFVLDRQPPQPIRELPPRTIPQNQDYLWIPGYWGWEPIEERFVWVSGIWRKAPEEMAWNPGYWANINQGYVWVSGYWSKEEQLVLTSQVPPDPERENPGRAPTPQHFWVPGKWDLTLDGFQWKSGFWSRGYEGRVWVPFRYQWTPRGYLTVPGYWDYDLEQRGVLFSPVAFERRPAPGDRYSPNAVIRTDHLPTHLFIDNDYGHYRFGDYYDPRAQRGQIIPWTRNTAGLYDPLQIFLSLFHRDRFDQYRRRQDYYFDHADQRPRPIWSNQQRQFQGRGNFDLTDALLSEGINTLLEGERSRGGIRFQDNQQRWNELVQQNERFREHQQKREVQLRELDKRQREQFREQDKRGEERARETENKRRERFREADKKRQEQEREARKKREEEIRERQKKLEERRDP